MFVNEKRYYWDCEMNDDDLISVVPLMILLQNIIEPSKGNAASHL